MCELDKRVASTARWISWKIRMFWCWIHWIDMMILWKHVLNLLWCMCNMLINKEYHMLTNILRNVIHMTFGPRLSFCSMYTNMRDSYKCGMKHGVKMILWTLLRLIRKNFKSTVYTSFWHSFLMATFWMYSNNGCHVMCISFGWFMNSSEGNGCEIELS